MAPKYRNIHTKIIDSFDFNAMPDDFTRVVWMLLIVVVDSEGRGIDNPAWLRSKLFPMRTDVELDQINNSFDWLSERKMIIRYEANNLSYFYIPSFKTHQRGLEKEAASLFPPCPDQLQTNSGVTLDLGKSKSRSESESESETNTDSYSDTNTKAAQVPELSKIIKFYESEIGLVTKTISDKIISYLDDKTNPQWILDAIRIAVEHNARNWAYIEAILKRWIAQGNQGDMRNSKSENQSLKNIEKWLEKQDAN